MQVFGPDWILQKGFHSDIDARNWRRLAQKLATPGSKIRVVAFGGSVTSGHLPMARNTSWVEQLEVWLEAAFPVVRFEVLNLARGATDVTVASTCWWVDNLKLFDGVTCCYLWVWGLQIGWRQDSSRRLRSFRVEQMEVWLQAGFPAVRFEVLNLARGATGVTVASTCWWVDNLQLLLKFIQESSWCHCLSTAAVNKRTVDF
jgi:hypothetical protein